MLREFYWRTELHHYTSYSLDIVFRVAYLRSVWSGSTTTTKDLPQKPSVVLIYAYNILLGVPILNKAKNGLWFKCTPECISTAFSLKWWPVYCYCHHFLSMLVNVYLAWYKSNICQTQRIICCLTFYIAYSLCLCLLSAKIFHKSRNGFHKVKGERRNSPNLFYTERNFLIKMSATIIVWIVCCSLLLLLTATILFAI